MSFNLVVMGLVTAKEVARAINLDKYGVFGTFFGWFLMKTFKISKLNAVYDKHKHLNDLDFLNALLLEFKIKFEIPEKDLKRLPKDGAYITISNHPLGGIDGILLLKLMIEQRQDYKIIANFLLHRIEPLKPYVMPVNPFEERKDAHSSISGFKQSIRHLREDHPLGMFPAGEVSTVKEEKNFVDKPWEKAAIKLIQKAEVPVVPIYFHAKNSRLFYRLSQISPIFRTAKLPSELFTQKKRKIKVRIGKPITVKVQKEYPDLNDFAAFLRKKTYMLANSYEKENRLKKVSDSFKVPKKAQNIVNAVSVEQLENEIEKLRAQDLRLLTSRNYEIFLAEAAIIPNILEEIGRLREITFREIGEGTNKFIDLDRFDQHYHHLFLWDNQAKKIAGAYRMGLGKKIFPKHGIKGFYLQELFRFEPETYKMMSEAIEMGRAFIIKEYQQKPLPLFLLWKGIVHTTLRFPDHNYLIGGVSISNQFSSFSKSLMIEFMKSHFYDTELSKQIHPKKEFKVKLRDDDKNFIFDESKADLGIFDKIIEEIEPENLRLPVLIKKYIKQNAKVITFNVDPLFNNAIDALMYIRIADLPESTVKPVMEEFQATLENRLGAKK